MLVWCLLASIHKKLGTELSVLAQVPELSRGDDEADLPDEKDVATIAAIEEYFKPLSKCKVFKDPDSKNMAEITHYWGKLPEKPAAPAKSSTNAAETPRKTSCCTRIWKLCCRCCHCCFIAAGLSSWSVTGTLFTVAFLLSFFFFWFPFAVVHWCMAKPVVMGSKAKPKQVKKNASWASRTTSATITALTNCILDLYKAPLRIQVMAFSFSLALNYFFLCVYVHDGQPLPKYLEWLVPEQAVLQRVSAALDGPKQH